MTCRETANVSVQKSEFQRPFRLCWVSSVFSLVSEGNDVASLDLVVLFMVPGWPLNEIVTC